ncbi:MAG: tRNA (adenosine(37)-N6)-threonylcarbamoyltransferase complex transferase subunit TsaD [Cyanobacteria bacterium]|nr:tRNA (adenosine(37)-N6)-threonylcarbamoyltransferase complex transferase subunit TsaD [Cyanobacteriota bacterium]
MKILALETSCDETSAAIVEDGRFVLANVIDSQASVHQAFGGVVPEVAARQHIERMNPCLDQVLNQAGMTLGQIDAFAGTLGPGLVGSLLVGANTAKTLSMLENKPFIGVNHLYGHVASNYLESDLKPPFLCLLVSGGHTQLIHVKTFSEMTIVGQTLDDAVGEAYDKIARLLELPYPGGPNLDELAQSGEDTAYSFTKAVVEKPFDFSFSGLKTAVMRRYEKALSEISTDSQEIQRVRRNIAASFQRTVVEILLQKTLLCAKSLDLYTWAIAGGVSANSAIRKRFQAFVNQPDSPYRLYIPPLLYCTDNAAMIGASAYFNPISRDLGDEVFSRVFQPRP